MPLGIQKRRNAREASGPKGPQVKDRKLEDEFRRAQRRVRDLETAATVSQHFYQSYAPGANPTLATTSPVSASVDLAIGIYPVFLSAPTNARKVSVFATDVDTGIHSHAFAFYKALIPRGVAKKAEQAITPGRLRLKLIDILGSYRRLDDPNIVSVNHAIGTFDIELDPLEDVIFMAVMPAKRDHQIFTGTITTGPQCGYLAKEIGERFGAFPDILTVDQGTRLTMPYFVIRSAMGARLYGDPEEG